MECNGVEENVVECNGLEWSGAERNGMESGIRVVVCGVSSVVVVVGCCRCSVV